MFNLKKAGFGERGLDGLGQFLDPAPARFLLADGLRGLMAYEAALGPLHRLEV